MVKDTYKQALQEARKELNAFLEQRAELDIRIARLRQTIGGLSQLCEGDASMTFIIQDMGLTEACREVLRASREELTPAEVIKGLERIGFDISGYSNLLAAVHTTLKRMTIGTNPEAIESEKDGKKAYKLKPPMMGILGDLTPTLPSRFLGGSGKRASAISAKKDKK